MQALSSVGQNLWTQFQPKAKEVIGIIVGAIVIAQVVHLILGRIGLFYYGAVVFVAYQWYGPAVRIWKHIELKGVLLALGATIFPFVPWMGPLGGSYMAVCIFSHQWQLIRMIFGLQQMNQDLKTQNYELQEKVKELQELIKEFEDLLSSAKELSIHFEGTLNEGLKAHENVRKAAQYIKETISYIQTLRKKVGDNPTYQELEQCVQEFRKTVQVKREELEKIQSEREHLQKDRENFSKEVAAFKKSRESFDRMTGSLENLIE